jgi:hypothetical protein
MELTVADFRELIRADSAGRASRSPATAPWSSGTSVRSRPRDRAHPP